MSTMFVVLAAASKLDGRPWWKILMSGSSLTPAGRYRGDIGEISGRILDVRQLAHACGAQRYAVCARMLLAPVSRTRYVRVWRTYGWEPIASGTYGTQEAGTRVPRACGTAAAA